MLSGYSRLATGLAVAAALAVSATVAEAKNDRFKKVDTPENPVLPQFLTAAMA